MWIHIDYHHRLKGLGIDYAVTIFTGLLYPSGIFGSGTKFILLKLPDFRALVSCSYLIKWYLHLVVWCTIIFEFIENTQSLLILSIINYLLSNKITIVFLLIFGGDVACLAIFHTVRIICLNSSEMLFTVKFVFLPLCVWKK